MIRSHSTTTPCNVSSDFLPSPNQPRYRLVAFSTTLCATCQPRSLSVSLESLCRRTVTTGPVKKGLRMAFALIWPYTSVTPSRRRPNVDDDVDEVPGLQVDSYLLMRRPEISITAHPPRGILNESTTTPCAHHHCLILADLHHPADLYHNSSELRISRNCSSTRSMRKMPRGQPCTRRRRRSCWNRLELATNMVGVIR